MTPASQPAARPGAVLIAGPTASGKSALAFEIARRIGGTVVNADSMQVYREMRILTARPSEAEEALAPHRLYGYRPVAEAHTVALWLDDVAAVIAELGEEGRAPVIVGGTGLYLGVLTEGLSAIPAVPPDIRARWRADAAERSAAGLHAELAGRDPLTAANLRPSDTQRVVRALEVLEATGRPLASFQGARMPPVLPPEAIAAALVLETDRADLHRRIEARFRLMVDEGGIEEARALAALGLDPALPAMKAIGVPEMMAAAAGTLTQEEAVAAAVAATRRYARRQETWFRNRMRSWRRVQTGNILAAAETIAQQTQFMG
jgi:tRNA dimethylallyltransferase